VSILLVSLFFGFWQHGALAAQDDSCYRDFLSLSQDRSLGEDWQSLLESRNRHGPFVTNAQIEYFLASEEGQMVIEHVHKASRVSLPYNLYAVEIRSTLTGKVVFFRDFTEGCQGAGASLYPGSRLTVGKITDGASETKDLWTVRVWGHL
jgi:hypothetical protein